MRWQLCGNCGTFARRVVLWGISGGRRALDYQRENKNDWRGGRGKRENTRRFMPKVETELTVSISLRADVRDGGESVSKRD